MGKAGRAKQTDSVCLAVADVEPGLGVHEDPVRSRQPAAERVPFRSVSPFPVAQDCGDDSALEVDHPDDVILGVGDVQPTVIVGKPLGTAQGRLRGGSAIAGVAPLARAGHMVDRQGGQVDPIDGVSLPQRQIQIAVRVERHRAGAVQRCAGERCAVRSWLPCSGAGPGLDDSGGRVHPADSMIADVADEQPSLRVERDAVRLTELGGRRRTAVAGKARLPGPGDGRDDAGGRIDSSDRVAVPFDDIEVSDSVELDFMRHVEGGVGGGPPVAAVAALAVAGDRRRATGSQVETTDPLVVQIAEVQRAIRTHDDPIWVRDLRVGETRVPGSDHGRDRRRVESTDQQKHRT